VVKCAVVKEGATLGAYRVVRKLGEGGMGVVYVAEHALLGRRAAIKVLLPEFSANKEIVQRFFNEAKATTQIADPGIVQVFDFGYHTDGSAFIVMELLEGEPMNKRLERIGRFSTVDCLRLMRQICTSLQAAHSKGVIHRDLKPDNIFLVGDPAVTGGERAKILDFGIAKLSTEEAGSMKTRTGMVLGTPVYMSPEQCRGIGDIDHRSDIYSIGCVMMTMLTGLPPFQSAGSGELIAAHLREPPPFAGSRVHGFPPIIDQILQCCLAKSPNDRFATMTDMAQAIGEAEQTLSHSTSPVTGGIVGSSRSTPVPVSTTLTAASGQAAPPGTGRRSLVAALAVTGVAAIIAIMVFVREHDAATSDTAGSGSAVDMTPIAKSVAPIDATTATAAAIDARVIDDAASVANAVIDASVPVDEKPTHHTSKHTNPGGNDHARPIRSCSAAVDRGD
jgi:serine/threonine protein kinase